MVINIWIPKSGFFTRRCLKTSIASGEQQMWTSWLPYSIKIEKVCLQVQRPFNHSSGFPNDQFNLT